MMKSEEHREWTSKLSEYMANELDAADQAALESHLAACEPCARALGDLKLLVAEAGSLEDIEPPTDLWAGIAAGIAQGGTERTSQETKSGAADASADVLPFPPGRRARVARPTRVEWSTGRLAAAAVVLVALTSSLGWWAGRAGARASAAPASAPGSDVVLITAAGVAEPPADLAAELAMLEEILESARDVLDPNTVLVIERSLGVIEQAISDSRHALAQDPGNAFLAEHLERMYRRKLVYLQDAVRLAELGA